MRLTTEQQRAFTNWVREKMEHHACQLCQSNTWKIGELIHPSSELVTEEFEASHSHDKVELICRNCGYVLQFDVRYIRDWQQPDESHSAVM